MDSIDSGMYEKRRTYDLHEDGVKTAGGLTAGELAGRFGSSLPLVPQRFRGGLTEPASGILDPRLQRFANDRKWSMGSRSELLKSYGARIDQPTGQGPEDEQQA